MSECPHCHKEVELAKPAKPCERHPIEAIEYKENEGNGYFVRCKICGETLEFYKAETILRWLEKSFTGQVYWDEVLAAARKRFK